MQIYEFLLSMEALADSPMEIEKELELDYTGPCWKFMRALLEVTRITNTISSWKSWKN